MRCAAKPSLCLSMLATMAIAACASSGCQHLADYAPNWNLARRPERPRPESPHSETPRLTRKEQTERKFGLARSLEQSGKLEQAAAAYESVLKADRRHAGAHHRLAVLCDQQGKPEEAEEHFRAALARDPKNAELLCDFGYCLYLRGKLTEAEKQVRKALAETPDLARAHTNLGLIQARSGRLAEAHRSFKAAGSGPAEAHANAAFALMLDEKWDDAHEQLTAALSIDPNSKLVRQRLSEVQAVLARGAAPAGDSAATRQLARDDAPSSRIEVPAVQTSATAAAPISVSQPASYTISDGLSDDGS